MGKIQVLFDANKVKDAEYLHDAFMAIAAIAMDAFDSEGPETTARNRLKKIQVMAQDGANSLATKLGRLTVDQEA